MLASLSKQLFPGSYADICPQIGHAGTCLENSTVRNSIFSASYVSSFPVRSSPAPSRYLMASIACRLPMTPAMAPLPAHKYMTRWGRTISKWETQWRFSAETTCALSRPTTAETARTPSRPPLPTSISSTRGRSRENPKERLQYLAQEQQPSRAQDMEG